MRPLGAAIALLLLGCNFSPLMNRIAPGEEPFVVIAGEGAGGQVDLFAVGSGAGALAAPARCFSAHSMPLTATINAMPDSANGSRGSTPRRLTVR